MRRFWAALVVPVILVAVTGLAGPVATAASCHPVAGYVQERPPEILRDRAGGEVIHNPPTPGQYPGVLVTVHGAAELIMWQSRSHVWVRSAWKLRQPLPAALLTLVAAGNVAAVRGCVSRGLTVTAWARVRGALVQVLKEAGYGIQLLRPGRPAPGTSVLVAVRNDSLESDLFHLAAQHRDARWEVFPAGPHGLRQSPRFLRLLASRPGGGVTWYRLAIPATWGPGTYSVWIALPANLGGATIYAGFLLVVP
jgi:hypothetical protein